MGTVRLQENVGVSEYQYYEFMAVDQPLTDKERSELRSISSRAEITATRFTNSYHYGNFKGSPARMMERYFDAHVYASNWGVYNFMLRFPRGVIHEQTLGQYDVNDALTYWITEDYLIISWQRNDEEGGGWQEEGEGWMARLLPIREEIERGDYRALYIGWLAAVEWRLSGDEEDDSADDDEEDGPAGFMEPPVPHGLGSPTAAQKALVEFLDIKEDHLEAAALGSPATRGDEDAHQRMAAWVAQVDEREAREYLLMVLRGEGRKAERQIRSRYHELDRLRAQSQMLEVSGRRSIVELRALVKKAKTEREKQEALSRAREKAERERKRREHLSLMARNFPMWWKKADDYVQEQTASGYDRARDLIVDLRDAYIQEGRKLELVEQLRSFTAKHARKRSLMRRLDEAGIQVL
jgi:hypothetical protein